MSLLLQAINPGLQNPGQRYSVDDQGQQVAVPSSTGLAMSNTDRLLVWGALTMGLAFPPLLAIEEASLATLEGAVAAGTVATGTVKFMQGALAVFFGVYCKLDDNPADAGDLARVTGTPGSELAEAVSGFKEAYEKSMLKGSARGSLLLSAVVQGGIGRLQERLASPATAVFPSIPGALSLKEQEGAFTLEVTPSPFSTVNLEAIIQSLTTTQSK